MTCGQLTLKWLDLSGGFLLGLGVEINDFGNHIIKLADYTLQTTPAKRLWIDNDGCPKLIRELVVKTSQRRTLPVVVVGNSIVSLPPGQHISMICVPGHPDAADDYIAEHVAPFEIVITADVPLAARVVAKGGIVLNTRGEVIDQKNIGERLATRNLLQDLRDSSVIQGGGPRPMGDTDKKRFADALDRLVTMLLRKSPPSSST